MKCTIGHKLELFTKEPYDNEVARCDDCKTEGCIKMGHLLHCSECKYNLCKNYDIDRNGKRFKTKL